MELLVILLNWNDTEQTLVTYKEISTWKSIQKQIIVVDNSSDKKHLEQLERGIEEGEILKNFNNLGYAGGNNIGLKYAIEKEIPYYLLLNTDAIISENGIKDLLQILKDEEELGAISPVIREGTKRKNVLLAGGRDISKYVFTRNLLVESQQLPFLKTVDYISGTIFLGKTECLKEVGLLDEKYFFSGEIADFCKRLQLKNKSVAVCTKVIAEHYTDKTSSSLRDSLYVYYNYRNRFLYLRKHYSGNIEKVFFWILQTLRQLPGVLLESNWKKGRALILALKDGLAGQFGNQNNKFI